MKQPQYDFVPYYLVYEAQALVITVKGQFATFEFTEDRTKASKLLASDAWHLQQGYPGSLVLDHKQFANFKLSSINPSKNSNVWQ